MLQDTVLFYRTLQKNYRLLFEMTKRDLSDKYAGQLLGTMWAIIHPVAMILVYLFIFGVVFRVKAAEVGVNFPADHAVYMLSGLIPWIVAAEVFSRSPVAISSQAPLVKQVVFPIEVLPVKMVLSTFPSMIIGFLLLGGYILIRFHTLPVSFFLLPVAVFLLYVFLFGVSLVFSTISIFFRDMKDIVQLYTLIGLYLAPIFYFTDWVPGKIRGVLYANPMTYFIMNFHDAAYHGKISSFSVWGGSFLIAFFTLLLGTWLFNHFKSQFGSFL